MRSVGGCPAPNRVSHAPPYRVGRVLVRAALGTFRWGPGTTPVVAAAGERIRPPSTAASRVRDGSFVAPPNSGSGCSFPAARENSGGVWYENGMKRRRILVVDDEPDVRSLVVDLLARDGYTATSAADGLEALRGLYAFRPDLVVLDVRMPRLDGWRTLERIRELTDVPVLMLTARDGELDKVRALRGGADDYVAKPFGRQELVARIEALLRRAAPSPELRETYADDLVSIDFAERSVRFAGREVELTPTEFRLLAAFTRHPNQVLSRDQLLELVWGDARNVAPDQVKLYVGYLRRKLEAEGEPRLIHTVRGVGYVLRAS